MSIESIVSLARKANNVAEARVAVKIMMDIVSQAQIAYAKAFGDMAKNHLGAVTRALVEYGTEVREKLLADNAEGWSAYSGFIDTFKNVWAPNLGHYDKIPSFELLQGVMAAALAAQYDDIRRTGTAAIERDKSGGVIFMSTQIKDQTQVKKNTLVVAGAVVAAGLLLFVALK